MAKRKKRHSTRPLDPEPLQAVYLLDEDQNLWIAQSQAEEWLGVSRSTICRWRRTILLPWGSFAGRVWLPVDGVRKWYREWLRREDPGLPFGERTSVGLVTRRVKTGTIKSRGGGDCKIGTTKSHIYYDLTQESR